MAIEGFNIWGDDMRKRFHLTDALGWMGDVTPAEMKNLLEAIRAVQPPLLPYAVVWAATKLEQLNAAELARHQLGQQSEAVHRQAIIGV